jgi:lipopolysaccharide transport system permease protein
MSSTAIPIQAHKLIYLRDLLRELVARDMKLRYKRSVLGFAWSLLNPLAQLAVLSFIFNLVLPLSITNYPAFLFTGLLAWSWFYSSLIAATSAIVDNRDLIKRPGFPSAILPTVTVTSHLVHFVLALPVLLVFLVLSGIHLTGTVLLLPLIVVLQFALTLGLAYLLATFHVTFRDTQYLLGIFLLLGFYLTPIFYDASVIPPVYQPLYRLNPMYHLIDAYRAILLRGRVPDLRLLAMLSLLILGLVWVGYKIFTRASYQFVEEL